MESLKEVLEKNKEQYIRRLMDLLAIDTHDIGHGIGGGLEKEGQDYMVKLFEEMGASKIEKDPMEEAVIEACLREHQEGNLGHDQTDRYNVYATFQGKEGGKSLLFNSHIDVMPADEADGWTHPPYEPVIVGDKLYGRGAADMKAGLMASAMAVKLLQDAGCELPGDVIITSVCDEEGGGNGSMQAVMRGLKADGVINCEGSSDELILAHMGWVFFKVEFEGRACHSGGKKNGVSAIDKAIKVIQALNEKEHDWLLQYKHPLLPAPNLNIGVIKGGTAGSTVPGECEFSTCVHFIPNQMSHDQVVKEFTDTVSRTAQADPWMQEHPPKVTMYQAGNGFEMEPDHAFVKTFLGAYKDMMGRDIKIVGSPSGCDSRLWRNIAGCPTIQFGPGNLSECHSVDEWVSVEAYLQSILVYANTILEWCKDSKN
ncbi:MAG: ArgE/DapE family deacylase [Lachnospiraceae bacterium]|jgi:acetylornithine deacetylase|nr:ArgE/DapE family deacylase [Lachnospiraceae bacterium]MCI9307830.1 ArgE/DapE family deacylase [Lachnospiraceae bacterium]